MLGGNLDGDQDVVTGGRDDDANRIDLVVRGIGAVEHAGDRVKADLARDAPLQVVLERRGGKRDCAVRPEPLAIGTDVTDAGMTGNGGGHVDIVLSRIGGVMERHKNGASVGWARRPSVAPTTLIPTPHDPSPQPLSTGAGRGALLPGLDPAGTMRTFESKAHVYPEPYFRVIAAT